MQRAPISRLSLFGMAPGTSVQSDPPRYAPRILPPPPGVPKSWTRGYYARRVNVRGDALVVAHRPFVWLPTKGYLPLEKPAGETIAAMVLSDTGEVYGRVENEVCVWDARGRLRRIGRPSPTRSLSSVHASAAGALAGWGVENGTPRSFYWTPESGMRDMGLLFQASDDTPKRYAGAYAQAFGFADEVVVGTGSLSLAQTKQRKTTYAMAGFRWTPTEGYVVLDRQEGTLTAYPTTASRTGWMGGRAYIAAMEQPVPHVTQSFSQACIWNPEIKPLLLPEAGRDSEVISINARGEAIISSGQGKERAYFYWSPITGVHSLTELFRLSEGDGRLYVNSINDTGVIAGTRERNGRSEAFFGVPARRR